MEKQRKDVLATTHNVKKCFFLLRANCNKGPAVSDYSFGLLSGQPYPTSIHSSPEAVARKATPV